VERHPPLTTHFKGATQLEAAVPASLLAEEGTASVAVTEGNSTSAALPFTLTDAPLSGLTLNNPGATEGKTAGTFTVATFTDANAFATATDFTATITWGDGTTATASGAAGNIVALGNGLFALLGSHPYAEEGSYTLSVQVADVDGAGAPEPSQVR
jgi:hypothetical protein